MCSMRSSNPKPWERNFKDSVEERPDMNLGEGRQEMSILAHQLPWPLFFFFPFSVSCLILSEGTGLSWDSQTDMSPGARSQSKDGRGLEWEEYREW